MKLLKLIFCSFIITQSAQAMDVSSCCCLSTCAVTGIGAYFLGVYHNYDAAYQAGIKKGRTEGLTEGYKNGATDMFNLHSEKIKNYGDLEKNHACLQKKYAELKQRKPAKQNNTAVMFGKQVTIDPAYTTSKKVN